MRNILRFQDRDLRSIVGLGAIIGAVGSTEKGPPVLIAADAIPSRCLVPPLGEKVFFCFFLGSPGIVSTDGAIHARAADSAAADITNNLYHGFESLRMPKVTFGSPRQYGGAPVNVGDGAVIPTYDIDVNSQAESPALNEADEQNLANPDLRDDPFHFPDLEWLYRQHDRDGRLLASRLGQLAPISFTNPADGIRRRRLFSLDS
jgi:hypothetical protein